MLEDVMVEDVVELVANLNFAEKVERSRQLIRLALEDYGSGLVVANSLGKDSVAVWHLAKSVSAEIPGFIVTTRYKPPETVQFMREEVARYPELRVFRNDAEIPDNLHQTDPAEGRAHAPGHRTDERHLLGHGPAMHRGPHPHGFQRSRGTRPRADQAQSDPDLARAGGLAVPGPPSGARQSALRPRLSFAGLRPLHEDHAGRRRTGRPVDRNQQVRRRMRHSHAPAEGRRTRKMML